ncbi:ubl carboxyl-terminal hydrolase 18-like isoform X1 [Mobula birostris]|uniref:ubl carboxyl-terminal hydrolase 18-like isoform X1 n=1 Tax=Mobula birostris TaxID=1983395 RepID=UPI003B286293
MSYSRYAWIERPYRSNSRSAIEERRPRGTDGSQRRISGTQALYYPQTISRNYADRDYTSQHLFHAGYMGAQSIYTPQRTRLNHVQAHEEADQRPLYPMSNTTDQCNRSSACLVKTTDPVVRTSTSSANERKLNSDSMGISTRNEIQRHSTTGCNNREKNTLDVEHEERRSTRYSGDRMFVGLINMGNSCCVNVLLQTLFMTPEYRNLILRCRQENILKNEPNHVPYQLDKMFQHLQDTKQIIASSFDFTWCLSLNHINVRIQMDVEELFCSVFCLVQDQLKGTDLIAEFNKLYTVTTEECIKCSQCQQETEQTGSMLTIPLSLYDTTNSELHENVENSLASFFEPQTLDDCNMCYCNKCKEKTITIKSYRKMSYPQILCLHLKRFNFSTGRTIKVYDFMEFPETLNVTEKSHSQMSKLQYHLLSVIVHIGSASFGHYYAYIRKFPEMDWYCFRDEIVSKATWEDVKSTFGPSQINSERSGQSGFQRGGTAYLLFYHRME